MVFTLLKAKGLSVGASLVEDEKLDVARELLAQVTYGPGVASVKLR